LAPRALFRDPFPLSVAGELSPGILFLFTSVIFLYLRSAIHRRCHGVHFSARRVQIEIENGNMIDFRESLSAKFLLFR